MGSPFLRRKRSWPPSRESSSQILSVRVSCQTIALYTGSPVLRSQTTVVSRWFVTPSPAMSPALPDLVGIVLYPAGLRVDLLVLELLDRSHLASVVEDHAARAGGSLI